MYYSGDFEFARDRLEKIVIVFFMLTFSDMFFVSHSSSTIYVTVSLYTEEPETFKTTSFLQCIYISRKGGNEYYIVQGAGEVQESEFVWKMRGQQLLNAKTGREAHCRLSRAV